MNPAAREDLSHHDPAGSKRGLQPAKGLQPAGLLPARALPAKGYRLEPIVDLLSWDLIGQELLAGSATCPDWNLSQWRDWYRQLETLIPEILRNQEGLLFVNADGNQLLDAPIGQSIRTWRPFASRVVIEWTEQSFHADNLVDVLAKLVFLKGMGFGIAIDDIGAGAGVDGLGRAAAIKADFCKIDGPYFQQIREEGPEYLRGLCQHLSHGGARVIVEWIETDADYRLALAAGAHLGQGWFWSGKSSAGTVGTAQAAGMAQAAGIGHTEGKGGESNEA